MATDTRIAALHIYPIKSCAGIAVPEAAFHVSGLVAGGVHDREWMLVTREGQFLTQREYPRLACITPRIDGDAVEVSAPGMPPLRLPLAHDATAASMTVQVWDDSVPAADCGDAAAAWFADVLQAPCRLVRFRPDVRRPTSIKWTGGVPAETRFADGYPVLLIGQASLDDLNAKLALAGRAPLPMDRFRPNLVVSGLEAFEEDYLASLSGGDVALRPVKPCARCPIPAIDQASGIPGPDPLDILQAYRANPRMEGAVCMGMNCIVMAGVGGTLRVGQQLDAAIAF
ncbi:MOSC N-terminal beta barrel domain-containing protein [Massilia oculi]|uniref:MOSC N-terminal beta barrel domain-containing protein n=1 Tax=Massilia hydrophila TaxID=3044279 RepID=A0ABS7YAL2_9BURK|nr:MOSC N-terminal beta barrel domain-containing protein [Massilia oculi]MCA1856137.1 MOSC N-terminal beta barrel domain-containing protein [Massilia oculi]